MSTPRPETLIRLTDVVFDKIMTVLRTPGTGAYELFNEYIDRLDRELDQPLRMLATVPETTKVFIRSNLISAGDLGAKTVSPVDDILNNYLDTTINFLGGSVSGGSVTTQGGVFSLPTATSGQFVRMAAVYQSANNAVDTVFSAAVAAVSGLANPGSLFSVLDGVPIGYMDLVNLGVSSYASAGDSGLIKNYVGTNTPTIYRFGSGAGSGGSALNDFKLKSISGNNLLLGKGFQELANGMVLVTGSGATAASLPAALTLNLTTIKGSAAAASTMYWLYVDLQNCESPFTLSDSGRPVIRVSTEANFKILTTAPESTNPIRYVPVGFIHSAADASWGGTGSSFGTTPVLRQTLDNRYFNAAQQFTTTTTTASGSITVPHGLGGIPDIIEFFYFDGTNTIGADASNHLLNFDITNITYSSLGVSLSGTQSLKMNAIFYPAPGQNISMAQTQPEFGWYTSTAVSSVTHSLTDASDIKGMSLIEWDVSADRYRVMPASELVTNYSNTTIFLDWTGLSPSATLQYRLITGGRTLPASIPVQYGGFTKFVGLGPGTYATVAAAVADSAAGDNILVCKSYSVSGEETISVSDIGIKFMPGVEVSVSGGTVGWRVTGNRVDIEGLNLAITKVGTVTDGLRVQGNDGNIRDARIRVNNASAVLTTAVTVASGALRSLVYASVRADAGTVSTPMTDAGTDTDISVRG